jgi:hypothetical protein
MGVRCGNATSVYGRTQCIDDCGLKNTCIAIALNLQDVALPRPSDCDGDYLSMYTSIIDTIVLLDKVYSSR